MKSLLAALLALILGGCATTATSVGTLYSRNPQDAARPRDIFIAIDGTGDSQISRTNAGRLFELVDAYAASRPQAGTATYYAEGVGSRGSPLGLVAGHGTDEDIKGAYDFLTRTWRPGDRIYLSGFSRGAYAVRALGGLVAIAGIPDLRDHAAKDRARIVAAIFDAYKSERRLERVNELFARRGIDRRGEPFEIRIGAMALWDTVEALGTPDGTEDPTEGDPDFLLTNCNVERVFHALALDDNRARSLTPIFATGPLMTKDCPNGPHARVEEVWFAGAHADVSGTYAPDGRMDGFLPGVSLNWMLDNLWEAGLFDPAARAFEDRRGPIHDAQAFNPFFRIFDRETRDPLAYHRQANAPGLPKVHISALERLLDIGRIDAESGRCPRGTGSPDLPRLLCREDLRPEGFIAEMIAAGCLLESETGYQLRRGQRCITVVCDDGRTDDYYCGDTPDLAAVRPENEPVDGAPQD